MKDRLLDCAESYLQNADKLIYSYGSRTFLSGYDLYDPDHDMRGNIDCSTFVILVLSGISYDQSPYALGNVKTGLQTAEWAERGLADFTDLPDHYVGIAVRIGHPELAGPKGLDLKKAEDRGISISVLEEEIRKSGVRRWSAYLAEYYQRKGTCFSDPSERRPGDLVFFNSKSFFKEDSRIYSVRPEISHVGIISEDRNIMIHSSGKGPAVSEASVYCEREIAFFAHPG